MKKQFFHFTLAGILLFSSVTPTLASLPSLSHPTEDTTLLNNEKDNEAAKTALAEFKSLSAKERRARIHDVKKVLKEYKAAKASGNNTADTNTILLVILAILLPPLAVYLHENEINTKFWISLLLTLLLWLPGVIYALIVILS
jgi:uncharacterized membrane protein YqaE (UPF0057 family)